MRLSSSRSSGRSSALLNSNFRWSLPEVHHQAEGGAPRLRDLAEGRLQAVDLGLGLLADAVRLGLRAAPPSRGRCVAPGAPRRPPGAPRRLRRRSAPPPPAAPPPPPGPRPRRRPPARLPAPQGRRLLRLRGQSRDRALDRTHRCRPGRPGSPRIRVAGPGRATRRRSSVLHRRGGSFSTSDLKRQHSHLRRIHWRGLGTSAFCLARPSARVRGRPPVESPDAPSRLRRRPARGGRPRPGGSGLV